MMGKYSSQGMGTAQKIISVGHVPSIRKKLPRSQKAKIRALKLYAVEHGLFLKVGPLLYPMGDSLGFLNRLDEVAAEKETGGVARRFIHEMYNKIPQQNHYVRLGRPRREMWVSVKQKAALFGNKQKEDN